MVSDVFLLVWLKKMKGRLGHILLVLLLNFLGLNLSLASAMECSRPAEFCTELMNGARFCNDEGILLARSLTLEGSISSDIGKFGSTREVKFEGNILTGTIPSEIGLMESLTGLGLAKNYITGTIPKEFYNLTNLGWLDFGDIPISGTLSSNISNLENIYSFELYNSNIAGTIPTEIGLLKNLLWMRMHDNDFSGTIPYEFATLPKLRQLELKGSKDLCNPGIVFDSKMVRNDLDQIPLCPGTSYDAPVVRNATSSEEEEVDCRSTWECEADGLKCNEKSGYCEMPNIFGTKYGSDTRKIFSPDCGLVGAIPEKLCELNQLEEIDLEQNDITGELPDCIFKLTKLRHLSLGVTKLRGTVPSLIGRLDKLTHLYLGDTDLKGQLPTEIGQLTELRYLDIKKTNINGTLPSEVGNLVNLKYFDLNGNRKFGHYAVQIRGTAIGSVPTQIGNLIKLTYLDLNDLNFGGDIPTELGKLQSLVELRLAGSFEKPKGIPSQIGNLFNLTHLEIKQNKWRTSLPTELGRMKSLTNLQARDGFLTGTIPTELGNLKNLKIISLESNNLDGTLPAEIGSLLKLKSLLLRRNKLYNQLPSELGAATSLKLIDVRGNGLSGIIPSELGSLHSLRALLLGNNRFTGKIPPEVGDLIELYQIDLSGNAGISGTLPEELGRLEKIRGTLTINGKLHGPIPSTVGNLVQLNHLDLNGNSFTGEIPSAIGEMKSLRVLSLRSNSLEGGVPWSLTALTELERLELGNNPLNLVCDCKLLSWYGTMVENLVYDSADVIGCSSDNAYKGLAVHTLRSDKRAPCSHATFLPNSSATPNSITFKWRYYSWTYSGLHLSEFENSNRNKTNISLELREAIGTCEAFWLNIKNLEPFVKFGFEIVANPGGIRKCFVADDVHTSSNRFSYTLEGLKAFHRYDISIRAIFFERGEANGQNQRISFVYGPRSKELQKVTLPSKPGVPRNVSSPSARDRQLLLQWVEPYQSNGIIIRYRGKAETSEGKTLNFTTEVSTIGDVEAVTFYSLQGNILNPGSFYLVSVQAETVAGTGDWSNPIKVMTCPENMRREGLDRCISTVGYFQTTSMQSRECVDILNFIETDSCLVEGLTIETLLMKEGYWRESLNSLNIRRCPNVAFCQQNSLNDLNTTDKYCTIKHTGVYCQSCKEPFVLVPGEGCIECTKEETSEDNMILAIYWGLMILLPVLLVYALVKRSEVRNKQEFNEKKKKSAKQGRLMKFSKSFHIIQERVLGVKLRILFGFLQVFMGFSNTFLSRAIEENSRSTLNFVINFNVGGLLSSISINCAWNFSHYDVLLIYTLFPIFFLLGLKVTQIILERCAVGKYDVPHYLEDTKMVILSIMFFIYPGVSSVIFATFDCEYFELADGVLVFTSALRADYQLNCSYDAQRIFMLVYSSFMVLIYPVGILVVYSVVLGIFSKSPGVKENKASKLLTYPYKENAYWYELFELCRKLIQTTLALVVFSFDQENYAVNAVASLVVSVIYLCIALRLDAYEDYMDFWFAMISLALLAALCLLVVITEVSSNYVYVSEGILTIVGLEVIIYVLFCVISIFKQLKANNKTKHAINDATSSHPDAYPSIEEDMTESANTSVHRINDEVEAPHISERRSGQANIATAHDSEDIASSFKIIKSMSDDVEALHSEFRRGQGNNTTAHDSEDTASNFKIIQS